MRRAALHRRKRAGVRLLANPPKGRAEEFKPQRYNLKDDPAKTLDLSAQHPDVVAHLRALLDKYRGQGHSRDNLSNL